MQAMQIKVQSHTPPPDKHTVTNETYVVAGKNPIHQTYNTYNI